MTKSEFLEFGPYLTSLWPKWKLTPEQGEIWWHRLQYVTLFDARKAAGDAYADGRWKEPTLSEILDALKAVKRGNVKSNYDGLPPEFIQRCADEEAETDRLLANYSDADLKDGKEIILSKEPELFPLSRLSHAGKWWRHLFCSRFVHHSVAVPDGNGVWKHIPVESHWAAERKLGPMAKEAML